MTGWREKPSLLTSGDPLDLAPDCLLDKALLAILAALLLFMPLAMGVVHPWSEAVVMGAVTLLAAGLLLRAFFVQPVNLFANWLWVPLILFLGLVTFQLLPLPAGLVELISPNTLQTKQRLLSDLPDAAHLLSHLTLTFYSLGTQHDLRVVLAAVIVFISVRTAVRTSRQIFHLLLVITCIGFLIALIAAAQDLSNADKIYWLISIPGEFANSGPFGLYNNFAQFMNLSLGAAIGLLLYCLTVKGPSLSSEENISDSIRTDTDLRRVALRSRRSIHAEPSFFMRYRVSLLVSFIVTAAITILLAGSRGGILSLIVSFLVTMVFVGSRGILSRQRWAMLVVAAAVFSALLYVGLDAVCDRLATLHNRLDPSSGRLQSFENVLSIWRRFPLLGTGLGTHQYVYPAYDHTADPTYAEQADGDYIQAAEEVGALGLVLILSFAAMVWQRTAVVIRRARRHGGISSVGFGLAFGLMAVMIHSFVDFGQHLPSIACLSATFCALLVNLADPSAAPQSTSSRLSPNASVAAEPDPIFPKPDRWSRLLSVAVAAMLLAAGVWSAITSDRVRRADDQFNQAAKLAANLSHKNWDAPNDDYLRLLTAATAAAQIQPQDVSYQYYLNLYRWQTVCHNIDPKTGMVTITPRTAAYADRIAAELNRARWLCPTFGPIYSVAGQLEFFVLHRPIGQNHVATGYALWLNHPIACFDAAMVAADAHHLDDAMIKFHHCLELDSSLFPSILQILLNQQHRPDLAVSLCDGNPQLLLQVVQYLPKSTPADLTLAADARRHAIDALKSRCDAPDAPSWMLAQTAYLVREDHDYPAAANYFRRALTLDYANVDWRLALADTLKSQGQFPDAMHEARICLRLRPQMPQAVQLIADLTTTPGAHFSDGDQ